MRQGQTYESCPGSLSPTALHHREGVGEVDTVVDTQPGGQHDVDTRDNVCSSKNSSILVDTLYSCVRAYGDTPVVKRADHVDQGEHDAGHHRHAEPRTGQQQGLQWSGVEWTRLLHSTDTRPTARRASPRLRHSSREIIESVSHAW